jgi:putative inorganic carbon (HCO3(-)) transporter
MIVEFIFLVLAGTIFILSPAAALLAMSGCMPFWIEWKFPGLFGVKLGLVDVAVVGGLLGILLFSLRDRGFRKVPLKNWIIAYMLVSVLSVLLSPFVVIEQFGRDIWVPYKEIYVTLSFFLFYYLLNSKEKIYKSVNLLLIATCISCFFGIIQAITKTPVSLAIGTYGEEIPKIGTVNLGGGTLRAFGTLWHSNDFAGFLIWPLSIAVSLFLVDKNYRHRKFLLFLIIVQGMALLFTFSRGGWVGFFISLLVITLSTKLYKRISLILLIPVILIMVLAKQEIAPEFDLMPGNVTGRLLSVKDVKEDPAMVPRYARWDYFLIMSLERPFTGFGLVTTEKVDTYFEKYAASPHNTFLFLAVKRGYIALSIIILIILKFFKGAKRVYVSSEDKFLKALGLGIFAGIIGLFGVSSMFASFLEETQINILFWFLLAVTLRSININDRILLQNKL